MAEGTEVAYVVSEIDRMRQALELDESVSQFGVQYLKQAIESEGVDIDSHDRLASTIFYITCRQQSTTVVLDDIVDVMRPNVTRKSVVAKAKRIQDALPIDLGLKDQVEFTERFCDDLGLDDDTVDEIVALAEKMENKNVLVNNEVGTFGGATIYAYAQVEGLDLTQQDIAEVTKVTSVTIRNNYEDVLEAMDRDIPPSVLNPESVHDGLHRLESLSAPQTAEARNRFETVDYEVDKASSEAAIAGAVFLIAGEQRGGITDVEEVATSVGASPQTIRNHKANLEEVLADDH